MPPPPLAGGGSAAGGGGSTGLSYPPPSSCGQYTQSACLWAQYAAQSNWQATVQVTVDLRQLNAGGVLCHAGGTSLAVGPSLDGVSTLTMTSSLGGCYSSGGGGNSQVTGTATVYGASTTSLDGCASISCFDDGGGAADKPSDGGEVVSDSTGAGELAALMDDEGGNGGDGGRGGNLGNQSSDLSESSTDLNPPSKRHYYNNVNQKTLAKALNSVILPGVDVGADVASINNGEVELVNGTYTVNGRTYGVHEGTLYPISGDGIYQLDRGAFKALGVYRSFGITERAGLILDRMGMSEMARQIALDVYKTAEGL